MGAALKKTELMREFTPLSLKSSDGEMLRSLSRQTSDARETLVFLHGFGRSPRFWSEWIPLLPSDIDIVLLAMRGVGSSSLPSDIDYSLTRLRLDVEEFLEGHVRGPIHLVGESFGGVVLSGVGEPPSEVETRSLVSTPTTLNRQIMVESGFTLGYPSFLQTLEAVGFGEWSLEVNRLRFGESNGDEGTGERYAKWMVEDASCAAFRQAALLDQGVDIRGTLIGTEVSTLLVYSPSSALIDADAVQAVTEANPLVREVRLDLAGHSVAHSNPVRAAETVMSHISDQ